MNLSELGSAFTGMPSGEVMGAIEEDLSGNDLGFENLCVSPKTSGETNGLSASAVKSDVSGTDRLLLAFNSINIAKSTDPTDDGTTTYSKVGGFESNGDTNLSGQDKGNDANKFDSIGLRTVTGSSAHFGTDGDVVDGIDKTNTPSPSLIFDKPSRRNTCKPKVNHKESQEKPPKRGKTPNKKSEMDFSSLQILRKSRSSISKRPRSSVWGYLGNSIPHSNGHDVPALNLGTKKKGKSVGSKRKSNSTKGQKQQEAVEKRCAPTGRISLKIKIGNKLCTIGNGTESCSSSGRGTTGSIGTIDNRFEESVQGIKTSHASYTEKLGDAFAMSNPLHTKVAMDNSSFSTSNDFHPFISPKEGDTMTASVENLCPDVGTSPDSEVINTVPDISLCEKALPNSPVLSTPCISPRDTSSVVLLPKKSTKENKQDELHQGANCTPEIIPNDAGCPVHDRVPISTTDALISSKPKDKSKKGKKTNKLCEPGYSPETLAVTGSSNVEVCDPTPGNNEWESSKCSGAKKGSKCSSKISDPSSKKAKSSKKKGNKNLSGGRHPVNEMANTGGAFGKVESLQETELQTPNDLEEIRAFRTGSADELNCQQLSFDGVMDPYAPSKSAWVLCDECEKWRRIPSTLADQIEETNCSWTCKENTDLDFADCSIPQEKSDSAINEELGISDGFCEGDAGASIPKSIENRTKAVQKSSWSLIKSNLFLHRSRKKQTIDEVMVCHCKHPSDGRRGCGTKCLNRMLNIECVQGTCPCGELCSNQQFQKRNYAKLKWFKCGKKGYGLQALEDVTRGQFLIEYVGEVLDVRAYEARQREYALDGHKHFYFMTLNGSEVIDACAKGNLGRFINHSCDPNCRTEKWMVNGEVCIGLFSLRDIKKGEEITFDYNYVRVFGAAAKKCVCGSPNCRGYIGGDPTSSEIIVQDDSDDEFSEPDMICGDRELNEEWSEIISSSLNHEKNEVTPEPIETVYSMENLLSTVDENAQDSRVSEFITEKVEGVSPLLVAGTVANVDSSSGTDLIEQLNINEQRNGSLRGSLLANLKATHDDLQLQMHSSDLLDNSLRRDGSLKKEISSANELVVATASPGKTLSDKVETKRKLKYAVVGGKDGSSKSKFVAKTKRSSPSVKKEKPKETGLNDKGSSDVDKLNAKSKLGLPMTNHCETVETKLNELLDPEGGISRKKDASKGYLKLLILTAASGNNGHGEAVQSNRDLSMILDALLKTKSRTVLVDIINKNGLQMLHNIMKRNSKDYNKTPILRKLLKVLEHLAHRQILTTEHITGGPPCPGVESFKDSILGLTEHLDKGVHLTARKFRNRWIPRSHRKRCRRIERDSDVKSESHQISNRDSLLTSNNHRNDQDGKPSETTNSCDKQLGMVETPTQDPPSVSGPKKRKFKSRWDTPPTENTINEDIPPGFSFPFNGHPIPQDAVEGVSKQMHTCNVILGNSQIRFNAHMPVSYGISKSFMQNSGVSQLEPTDSWSIAPAVPFLPFPPLPPQPCSTDFPSTSAARSVSVNGHTEDASACYQTGQKRARTSSIDPHNNFSVPNGQLDNGLGRKYFRQQKSNHPKVAPPWVRMRNGWGYPGNNLQKSNAPGGDGFRNVHNWQETIWRG